MTQEPLSDPDTVVLDMLCHMRPDVRREAFEGFVREISAAPYLHVDMSDFRRMAEWALRLRNVPDDPDATYTLLLRVAATGCRVKSRIDAIVERDGSEQAAVEGSGVGISYLFARDIYRALGGAHCQIGHMRDEIDRLRAGLQRLIAIADSTAESANIGMMDEAIAAAREIVK